MIGFRSFCSRSFCQCKLIFRARLISSILHMHASMYAYINWHVHIQCHTCICILQVFALLPLKADAVLLLTVSGCLLEYQQFNIINFLQVNFVLMNWLPFLPFFHVLIWRWISGSVEVITILEQCSGTLIKIVIYIISIIPQIIVNYLLKAE